MKIAIDDVFDGITPHDYERHYFDETFNETVGRELHMGRELLRLDRTAERIVRHVRYEPARDPGSDAAKAFGTSRASFLEELDYDVRTRRGTWRTTPNLWPDRVTNAGTIEFADAPSGTRRSVRGEVKVKLFGFGGLVERMIVGEIVQSYARTAKLTRAWLAR